MLAAVQNAANMLRISYIFGFLGSSYLVRYPRNGVKILVRGMCQFHDKIILLYESADLFLWPSDFTAPVDIYGDLYFDGTS